MKITKDGVTLEGSPSELAEYESKMNSRRPSTGFSVSSRKRNSFSSSKSGADIPEELMEEFLMKLEKVRKTKKYRRIRGDRVLSDRGAFTVHWWKHEFGWNSSKIKTEIDKREMGKNGKSMKKESVGQLLLGTRGYIDIGFVFNKIYPNYVSRVHKGAR